MASSPDSKGRFTPKKSKEEAAREAAAKSAGEATAAKQPAYQSTGRYTAPAKVEAVGVEGTKPWVPYVMFGFLAIGLLMIILNYAGVLPAAPSNWYLLGGLACITGGFFTATQLK